MGSGTSFSGVTPSCSLIVVDNGENNGCEGGHYYTSQGCEPCGAGTWLPAGDTADKTSGSCNQCATGLTSDEGSDEVSDCRYNSCSCQQVVSNSESGDGKSKISCTCV